MNKFHQRMKLYKEGSRKFGLIIGFCAYLSAIFHLFNPYISLDGRWAWVFKFFVERFGENGPAILYFLLGTLFIVLGLKKN